VKKEFFMEWFLAKLALTIVFGIVAGLTIVFYVLVPGFFIYLIYIIVKGLSNGK
jgi:hypothetical protein